ncbi:unnamed protein product, partial [Rotaria sordida]
ASTEAVAAATSTINTEASSITLQISTMAINPRVNRVIPNIPVNARWAQNAVTVAKGNGKGDALNQLNDPCGLSVDDDQMIVIADCSNHRIAQWKATDTKGHAVAGGHGPGYQLNQLNCPTDVLIDKETDSLIISDQDNQRV